MSYISDSMKYIQGTFNGYGWIILVFLVVLFTMIANAVVKMVLNRLHAKLKSTKNYWDDTFIDALRKPLGALIWLLGFSYAAEITMRYTVKKSLLQSLSSFREIGILIIVVWFAIRFIRKTEKSLLDPSHSKYRKVDPTLVHAAAHLISISVVITGALVGLQMLEIKITALLAFGGVGGLGIALAARDLIANFFGGLMVYIDRPFKVGDWIRSPDKEIEGVVEYVGWRSTRIRTFDKRPLYVPNGLFTTISVENPSRMKNRRIKTHIGVRYDDAGKMEVILNDVEEMLRNHPEIDTNQTLFVKLVEFGPSSLNFLVYTFTKTTKWVEFQGIQQDVFLKIIKIIERHDAECAFPTRTLHIPENIQLQNI